MEEIDLASSDNLYLIPPYIHSSKKESLLKAWKELKLSHHVFILSSGTTTGGIIKSYALSKSALVANARAVNQFLDTVSEDTWLNPLPHYHVGGLGIYIRAQLSDSKVEKCDFKWDPEKYYQALEGIQYSSLVPTQLYDLVSLNLKAPIGLKGIFIGGDFLSQALRDKALELGYPLIQTYGMTELCSQIASSYLTKDSDGFLEILPIHHIDKDTSEISSPALATLEMILAADNAISVTKYNKNFHLKDNLEFLSRKGKQLIKPMGRSDSMIKIKGRLFNLLEIQEILESIGLKINIYREVALQIVEDAREGRRVQFLLESSKESDRDTFRTLLEQRLPPPLLPVDIVLVDKIQRTKLGKVKRDQSGS